MARHITVLIAIVVAGFILLSFTTSSLGSLGSAPKLMHDVDIARDTKSEEKADFSALSSNILEGGSIAPKLENATAKYVSLVFIFHCPILSPYACPSSPATLRSTDASSIQSRTWPC